MYAGLDEEVPVKDIEMLGSLWRRRTIQRPPAEGCIREALKPYTLHMLEFVSQIEDGVAIADEIYDALTEHLKGILKRAGRAIPPGFSLDLFRGGQQLLAEEDLRQLDWMFAVLFSILRRPEAAERIFAGMAAMLPMPPSPGGGENGGKGCL